jgi:hypothetical protein
MLHKNETLKMQALSLEATFVPLKHSVSKELLDDFKKVVGKLLMNQGWGDIKILFRATKMNAAKDSEFCVGFSDSDIDRAKDILKGTTVQCRYK